MSSKKVLVIAHGKRLYGGGEISNHALMKYLKKKGLEVRIVLPATKDTADARCLKVLKDDNIPYYFATDYGWIDNEAAAYNSYQAVYHINNIIAEYHPDVVMTNTIVVPWGALSAAMNNIPHLLIVREPKQGGPVGKIYELYKKGNFIKDFSETVMANSMANIQYLKNYLDIDANLFYSFVDTSNIKITGSSDNTRIVSISHFEDKKNQMELLRAVLILKEKYHIKNQVVLIGEYSSQYGEEVKEFIKNNGLSKLVSLSGYAPNPWQLVNSNDLIVLCSKAESIGRVAIEAEKLGIPIVFSDNPGHQEVAAAGGGILYKLGDVNDLAKKIHYALENYPSIQKDAAIIKVKITKNLSEENCCRSVYDTIIRLSKMENSQKSLSALRDTFNSHIKCASTLTDKQAKIISNLDKDLKNVHSSKSYKIGRAVTSPARKIKKALKK